jgi:hypothetical protein
MATAQSTKHHRRSVRRFIRRNRVVIATCVGGVATLLRLPVFVRITLVVVTKVLISSLTRR